jgi:hypothetical protein
MIKLKVVGEQGDVVQKNIARDGEEPKYVTNLVVQSLPKSQGGTGEEGAAPKIYINASAWGDKKAFFDNAIATNGGIFDAEEIEEKTKKNGDKYWAIRLEGGAGTAANQRGKFGKRDWVPAGYKGIPIPTDKYLEYVDTIATHAAATFHKILGKDASAETLAPVVAGIVCEVLRQTERNVTFPKGYEPAAPAAKPAEDNPSFGDLAAEDKLVAELDAAIDAATTTAELQVLLQKVLALNDQCIEKGPLLMKQASKTVALHGK